MSKDGNPINRRRLLQGLGAVSGASILAGCQGESEGGSSDGSENLGEMVPEIRFEWWPDYGGVSRSIEAMVPLLVDNWESLGLNVETQSVAQTTSINDTYQDLRQKDLVTWGHGNDPIRLDPHFMTRRFAADWAGGNGQSNPPNWANCDYTEAAVSQAFATSQDDRRALVNEAHSIISEEVPMIPYMSSLRLSIGRSDLVDVNRTGRIGVGIENPMSVIASEPENADTLVVSTTFGDMYSQNPYAHQSPFGTAMWAQLVHTPLTHYDENNELQNQMAEEINVKDEFKTVEVRIKDGFNFHNGDPVTAEDVKFTYTHLQNNLGSYTTRIEKPYDGSPDEAINILDDRTVEFNFSESYPPILGTAFPQNGIVHKETWVEGGAPEDPPSFDFRENPVGSGPYRLSDLEVGGPTLILEPWQEEHSLYNPNHNVLYKSISNESSKINQFRNGELHFATISPQGIQTIEEEFGEEMTWSKPGFVNRQISIQTQMAPGKFTAFRKALGRAIDREQMNQVVTDGLGDVIEVSHVLTKTHPWRPPEDMLTSLGPDPTGDAEGARQALQEEGWGFDDQGRLHYPPDADLSPLWPKGETPSEEDFPCVNMN